jgi:hypothetical protein
MKFTSVLTFGLSFVGLLASHAMATDTATPIYDPNTATPECKSCIQRYRELHMFLKSEQEYVSLLLGRMGTMRLEGEC